MPAFVMHSSLPGRRSPHNGEAYTIRTSAEDFDDPENWHHRSMYLDAAPGVLVIAHDDSGTLSVVLVVD